MLSLASLQKIHSGLRSTVAALNKQNDALNSKITQFEADAATPAARAHAAEQIKEAREAVVAKARVELASMRDAAEVAGSQVEYWASAALLLSLTPFDPDPAVDALMRTRYAVDLAAMAPPLLALMQENALGDFYRTREKRHLALAWACVVAGAKADLSAVEIPEQQQALDLIADCDKALAEAEGLIGAMSGQHEDPVRKLERGHRIQWNRPTRHNSPGRPVTP